MTEFTSGPWLPEKGFYGWRSVVASSTGYEIARIESGEANAQLIAAAPDVYAALAELMEEGGGSMPESEYGAMMTRAKAALAKARGETTWKSRI